MIGRERELETLAGIWERVASEGRAHFVTVFGPAGIGKSRLGLELSQLVAGQGGRVVRGRSTPYGAEHAVQRVRATGEAGRRDLRQRRPGRGTCAKLVRRHRAARPDQRLRKSTRRTSRRSSVSVATATSADRETLFFSARVFVESLALDGPDAAPLRGHPLGRREPPRPARDARRARPRGARALRRARAAGAPRRAPRLGRRPPRVHGAPLEPLTGTASHELAQLRFSPSPVSRTTVPSSSPRRRRATRCSSRSSRPRSPRARRRTSLPTSIRAIIAARLDSLPTEERSVLVDASVVGTGLLARRACSRSLPRSDLATLLGSLEARDLIRREAVSRFAATSSSGSSTG